MIKAEIVREKGGVRLYLEAQNEDEIDDLDSAFEVIMSKGDKIGGYTSSLRLDVLLLNKK